MRTAPRIYNLHPKALGPIDKWAAPLRTIRQMGFDTVWLSAFYQVGASGHRHAIKDHCALDASLQISGLPCSNPKPFGGGKPIQQTDRDAIHYFVQEAAALGLAVMIDLVATHTSWDAPLRNEQPHWFALDSLGAPRGVAGPIEQDSAAFNWEGTAQPEIESYIQAVISFYATLGVRGFRCADTLGVPASVWRRLITATKTATPSAFFCADTLGKPIADTLSLTGVGFDFIFNSVKWWDGRAGWFVEMQRQLSRVGRTIGFAENLDGDRLVNELGLSPDDSGRVEREYKSRYARAAALSAGVVMQMGYETASPSRIDSLEQSQPDLKTGLIDVASFIGAINRLRDVVPLLDQDMPLTVLGNIEDRVQAIRRAENAQEELSVVINTDPGNSYTINLDWLLSGSANVLDLEDVTPAVALGPLLPILTLEPFEVRIFRGHFLIEAIEEDTGTPKSFTPSRVIIENPSPSVDNSRFPAKRIVGDVLHVSADIFRDGHDHIAAAIRLNEEGEMSWRLSPMRFFDNDRWIGSISLKRKGKARYAVEAWTDHFGSWVSEVKKKRDAGQTITLEIAEGRELLVHAIARADSSSQPRWHARLKALLQQVDNTGDDASSAGLLLSQFATHAVAAVPDKADRAIYEPAVDLLVERAQARYASWYEMFPRSQGTVPDQAATFADCTKRLPEIRDLGFHVIYMVPIHPIGKTNRKGRDNSLIAGTGDPGSPYAIGSEFGGHDAIDPDLGTIDDFRAFQQAVRDHSMELAMDFAIQCSPDHPWLNEHPTWFRHRPDGSIKFAENPPKKYEDIVNIDFESPDWREIWNALRDVILFWVGEGVKIFRVDNPHTKPVSFWHWMIAEVKARDPDVLFLAEAFTRPKMMRRLAKVGFTQSYSYFTWRNTKVELTEYLIELTTGPSRDYYQPNFFANTPDILPIFLQTGGRPGFHIRLTLAATLSPVYGIYNGFELCEAEAVPGKEDYLHSEKYQYKVWDWDRPGHIKDDVKRLNKLREASSALQHFTNLKFHSAYHPDVIFYSKISSPETTGTRPDEVFIIVNLNPFASATVDIEFPVELIGIGENDAFETEELFTSERQIWRGRRHTIVLDPARHPAMVLHRIRE